MSDAQSVWSQLFGGANEGNRAERRARQQDRDRMARRMARAYDRRQRTQPKKEI